MICQPRTLLIVSGVVFFMTAVICLYLSVESSVKYVSTNEALHDSCPAQENHSVHCIPTELCDKDLLAVNANGGAVSCQRGEHEDGVCCKADKDTELFVPINNYHQHECGRGYWNSTMSPGFETTVPISAGKPAEASQLPWLALFFIDQTDANYPSNPFCGGTLITNIHVLTAAHCANNEDKNRYRVAVGELDVSTEFDVQHEDRSVKKVIPYDHYSITHDIAIVFLEDKVEFGRYTRRICLPDRPLDLEGENMIIAGWGPLKYSGEAPTLLHWKEVVGVSEKDCEDTYNNPYSNANFNVSLVVCCKSLDKDKPGDSCQGDSGGPLLYRSSESDAYKLVGVVSLGHTCGSDLPGIYTKIYSYLYWILRTVDR